MRLASVDLAIMAAYLAGILGLGLYMKRRASRNLHAYFLGGRALPWWALAMSGSSSYFDITGTMWIVSLFFLLGVKGMWVQWIWGFPITVFYMTYMGKWIRRSGVMTGAEWMRTRFGGDAGGQLARVSYTLYAVLTITAFLAYGSHGMGKFGAVFLPPETIAWIHAHGWNEVHVCSAAIIGLTGFYVVLGGFHGIVLTEIVQTIVLSAGALAIAYLGWAHTSYADVAGRVSPDWISMAPGWQPESLAGTEYAMFGALLLVWIVKGLLLDLSGPEQLYDFQRFLAVRNARDACKLGALWGVIHTVRWPMAMALAALALGALRLDRTAAIDAETILPLVIDRYFGAGFRGLALAALLSGFLATFSSTVNGGASYIVKDIYHRYLRPNATDRQLITASYAASTLLIVAGIVIGFGAKSIGQMFTWIMGTLGAGVLLPNVLRWYWWRLNGWGYGVSTIAGMGLSLVQALGGFDAAAIGLGLAAGPMPLYVSFPLIAVAVLVVAIAVTLLTPPTDARVLAEFYRTVQPAGWWGAVDRRVRKADPAFRREPFARDLVNVLVGLPGLLALYHFPIYLVLHRYAETAVCLAVVAASAATLAFTWRLHLPAETDAGGTP
jgi:SSS family solute:Na+ symporter